MFQYGRMAGCLALVLASTLAGLAQQQRAPAEAQPKPVMAHTKVAYPTGDPATSVILLERFAPSELRAGMDLEYRIRITNLTRVDLREVALTEQFPPNFTPLASSPKTSVAMERQAIWKWPRLNAGATETIYVQGSTTGTDELTFCATVSFATAICSRTNIVEPKLVLTKELAPEVLICDPIPMRLVVSNIGSGAMHNVRITDALPRALATTDGMKGFAIDVGDLAAGQSREYNVTLRASETGEFTNTARAQEAGGLRVESSAKVAVRQPVLALSERGPSQRYVGRPATFELTVQNVGDAAARDVVLTSPVPAGTEVVSAPAGQLVGGNVTWRLGTLAPQAARTVEFTVKSNDVGPIYSTATAEAYCARATANASVDVKGIPAILLEVVDDPDPIELGGNVTYTIEVTNQGSAASTNIVMTCMLPAELQYVSASGPAQGSVDGQSIRFAPLASLAPKAKVTYKLVATGTKEADARFKVVMQSDQTTTTVEETESTHIY